MKINILDLVIIWVIFAWAFVVDVSLAFVGDNDVHCVC